MCGVALSEIMALALNAETAGLRPLNIRPPIRNISLQELAELDLFDEETA